MTTKHTPGPWKLCFSRWANAPAEVFKGTQLIASVEQDESPDSPALAANARLIAAAPDLLHAIRELLGCTELNLEEIDDTTAEAIEIAQKALAKAEGR